LIDIEVALSLVTWCC